MTSPRPFLLRALYEWIVENGCTPHLVANADTPGTLVPPHAVQNGRITLNIAASAVGGLKMDNEAVSFTARFGGVVRPIYIPIEGVLSLYARETGAGMGLPTDEQLGLTEGVLTAPAVAPAPPEPEPDGTSGKSKGGRGHLRVVK